MRILKEQTAAVLIDVQQKLFPHIHEHAELERRLAILLNGLHELEIPLLVTEQYVKGLGPTLSSLQEIMHEPDPVEKMCFSCADNAEFATRLENLERDHVILAGIEAHVCVMQTAVDLIEEDYVPVVVADCVSSRNPRDRDVALERMRQEGAIITTMESLLFELCREAGAETFKAISKLVK